MSTRRQHEPGSKVCLPVDDLPARRRDCLKVIRAPALIDCASRGTGLSTSLAGTRRGSHQVNRRDGLKGYGMRKEWHTGMDISESSLGGIWPGLPGRAGLLGDPRRAPGRCEGSLSWGRPVAGKDFASALGARAQSNSTVRTISTESGQLQRVCDDPASNLRPRDPGVRGPSVALRPGENIRAC
jgi:hypothetical protein